ncbi:hypothetical protein BOX15_Mlig010695g1, partial [Macrostomum lignano]
KLTMTDTAADAEEVPEVEPEPEGGQTVQLDDFCELRFEALSTSSFWVKLVEGKAEVFGTELVRQRRYHFPAGSKAAVFTFSGCELKVWGETESRYTSKDTHAVTVYVNCHAALQQLRRQAQEARRRGPRVLVCGPKDAGKTSLCRQLVSWATREKSKPIYVDVDVGQSQISVPGTMGAVPVRKPFDIEEGLETEQAPVLFQFGHTNPQANINLYFYMMNRLAEYVNKRCEYDQDANYAGLVINTCGWIKLEGYDAIKQCASAFEVDLIFVIESERLYNDLKRDLPSFVKIVTLPKSRGVADRGQEIRQELRDRKVTEYFKGPLLSLSPHRISMPTSAFQFYRLGVQALPSSLLPLGHEKSEREEHWRRAVRVLPDRSLLHALLGVSQATSSDQLADYPVYGFCVVVDVLNDSVVALAPASGTPPSNLMLVSTATWMMS